MGELLVLRLNESAAANAEWIVVDDNGSRLGPPVTGPLAAAGIDAGERPITVLVPATDVLTTSVDMPVKSAAKIQQALPFALEESVAQDIDDLHFAAGPRRDDGRIQVAAVEQEKLDAWLARLAESGLLPARMVPENHGLAVLPGTISLMLIDDCVYANDGADLQLVLQDVGPVETLEALGALGTDKDTASAHVLAYCDADNQERYAAEFDRLKGEFSSMDVKMLPDGGLPRLAVTVGSGAGINLLQGGYGKKTEYASYFRPWRYAAVALLALMVTGLAGKAISTWQLDRQESALRDQFMAEYREIAPGASEVRDPAAVVSSLRARLGGGTGVSSVFLDSLEQLSAAMQSNDSASITAINYRAGIVDVRISAPSVAVLDAIRQSIASSDRFTAEIQSTVQDDESVNSRIQIRPVQS